VALIEQLPLTLGALALTSLVVCAGTALQVATGVGLGLLAGPVLILSLESGTAIFVAIILNLLVSFALLPQEKGEIYWPPLRLLLVGTLVGVPLGWLVLQQIDATTLKLFTGVVVLAAAIQLLLLRWGAAIGDGKTARLRTLVGGGFSGFMSGCLAIPGPVAMWTLLQQDIAPSLVRATLRALFVFSYGAAFLIHFGLGGETGAGWSTVAALVPALAVGVVLGVVVKRNVREATLHVALRLLLLAMGLSLLWKGISDVTA
jgi:uncharacterized membrane protein YfcA